MSVTTPLPTNPPTTEEVDVFGPMVSRGDITRAVITQLQSPFNGLIFYLAERERRLGLPPRSIRVPPSPASYRMGLDFETWGSDELPVVIVIVQAEERPQRFDAGRYDQFFTCQLVAIVEAQSELEAIDLADNYGISLAMCVGQNPDLSDYVTVARMLNYPMTEFPNSDRRNLARSIATYQLDVDPVFDESFGPWPPPNAGPPPDPYAVPVQFPFVTEVTMGLTSENAAEVVSPLAPEEFVLAEATTPPPAIDINVEDPDDDEDVDDS